MADNAKAKSAKERLEAAKKAAEEAEIVEPGAEKAPADASDSAVTGADVAETVETSDHLIFEDDAKGGDPDPNADAHESDEPATVEDVVGATEEAERRPEDAQEADRQDPDDHPHEAGVEETSGSLAATVLKFLAILFVGGAAALWAGPKIAPNLPGWAAPVAAFLTPGTNEATQRIDAVAQEGKQARDALSSEVEAARAAAEAADAKASDAGAAVEQARADLSADIANVAEEPRADLERMNELASRLVSAEATVEGLRAELDALSGLSTEDAAPSAEVLERVAAFGASVEGLRAEIAALKARTAQIEALAKSEDLAALSERVAALEEGEAATAGARDEASDIRRAANIAAAVTRIEQALLSGSPYAAALADATSLSGESAPAALSDNAASGLPTQETLASAFPSAAQAGYAAALEETAGKGFAGGVFAKLQGRLGGRPSIETEGDDAGAVLSRIEARLKEGRLSDAAAEAEGLSDAVRAAMADWLDDLFRASEGAASFAAYRDTVTTN